jgi:signal transduction histidine kinase
MVELSSEKIIELVIWSTIGVALLVFFLVWALFQHYRVLIKKKHELVTTIIETQEKERFRIAQDLHDNFGNFLNIIHLEISTLEQIKNIERMQTTFGFLLQNVDLARKELTGNILDLAPNSLKPIDWIEEVRRIFHILNKEKNNFILTVEGQIVEYSQVNQTNLFRICQELINNTLKYSQATEVKLMIKFYSTFVEF